MQAAAGSLVQFILPRGSFVRTDGGFSVHVVSGRLWITRPGVAADTFVGAGQSCTMPRAPGTLIEADRAVRFELRLAPVTPIRARGVRALRPVASP